MVKEKVSGIGFFEKYLTLWVAICMIVRCAHW
jgi:ACR3 family arsenite efflux pump ArsB